MTGCTQTLTQSLSCCCLLCCLFFSSSAYPQTDTAQLYNTHLDRTGLEFNHHIILYDRIALGTHIYKATRAERIQIANNWILTANSEGEASTQSTTRHCSSEKRMETIARRAPGKDPARLQNHPSQSTSTTKKRTTVRRNRRIRLRGWLHFRLEVLLRVVGRRQRGTKPSGRRAIGSLSILQVLIFQVFSIARDASCGAVTWCS